MAAKMILSLDGQIVREFPLNKERMTIGRKPQNDIHVDNLAVSGEHAAIITILNDSFMEDLGSTNGTLVNGNPVKKHFLQSGDVIEIGRHKLKYVNDLQATSTPPSDLEQTMVIKRPPRPVNVAPAAVATATATAATAVAQVEEHAMMDTQMGVRPFFNGNPSQIPADALTTSTTSAVASMSTPAAAIQVLNGPNAGRVLDLTKALTTIGKPQAQVAVITRRPNGYFLTHVEGERFPLVNGLPVHAQASALKDHDVIEIAGIKMEFFLKV
jgi:pSer/pThr/pTyr-binding forkhead associated (FHA) protein